MNVIGAAARTTAHTVGRAASATLAGAGALGGAAVTGTVGAAGGAIAGIRRGAEAGSHSTPAAALTLGAIGLSGLVEWPVLAAVGGGALVLRTLNRPAGSLPAPAATPTPAPRPAVARTAPPGKATARKAPARKAPARKATARK
ncbi:hypothetical protein H7J07_19365 [Mycobacterium koreense]|uniref:Uncharacterized protein n=1 Tax=Mycolicibacillus koreensis TaxID=1069220 RepID=A0A7I7SJX3_9MYCO|nr:hypothetical protein [Mycolicibacillus koreensis]MCV7250354.1 hypothetical protein [Mycolicibacillus koreensis]ODR06292.1 hypothetical protein BHQ15_13360 [Mycolicibacillus koreensis]OSC33660.1 hypothetical protein B8W67_09780 [Mycolicibacillus koreensis]BBY56236.1 hypothetical protein MKOR_34870 [Mycolicibacillus koreensis]